MPLNWNKNNIACKRLAHVETQICFFVIPFFNLATKLGFMCLSSFSRQSFVNCDVKSKTTWALWIWTVCLIGENKLCVCAELADTFEILMLFEILPKHMIPAQ